MYTDFIVYCSWFLIVRRILCWFACLLIIPRKGKYLSCLSGQLSGNLQLILSAAIRHLDHKNISHDPHLKSDVIRIASIIVQQLRLQAVVVDVVVVSDLFRHLRKSLEAIAQVTENQELNLNITLQNSVEGCLLEIAKGVRFPLQMFDVAFF